METPKTEKQIVKTDKLKSNAIMHAIEIESNFKLYAYRIITDEVFVQRTLDLAKLLKS